MVFQGNYLRVSTPRTLDGVTPLLKDEKLQYKEDFLPLSAKPFLEAQNKDLPDILKKKIEIVRTDDAVSKEKKR